MTLPRYDVDVRALIRRLQESYGADEMQRRVSALLTTLRRHLAASGADARLVAGTYRRLAQKQATKHEIAQANRALRRLLAELGVAAVGILPGGFITLPALYALARHFHVELVPGTLPEKKKDPPPPP